MTRALDDLVLWQPLGIVSLSCRLFVDLDKLELEVRHIHVKCDRRAEGEWPVKVKHGR